MAHSSRDASYRNRKGRWSGVRGGQELINDNVCPSPSLDGYGKFLHPENSISPVLVAPMGPTPGGGGRGMDNPSPLGLAQLN